MESIATPAPLPVAEPGAAAILCPLCDYDLRGQTEPRCPECGYRFDWSDLTDPAKKLHPYLFEHHPRRNVWSLVRTMLGGLRPRRFWSSLKPSQPSRPGRLLLYWLLANLMLLVGYVGVFAYTAYTYAPQHRQMRAQTLAWANQMTRIGTPPGSWVPEIAQAGGPQTYVDRERPPVGSAGYIRYVYRAWFQPAVWKQVQIVMLYLLWPWLTLATLMIFRASMRRAKVRAVHVLRCALYCCDAGIWLGVGAAFVVPVLVERFDWGRYIGYHDRAVASVLFAAVTTWRLSAAYRHYLRFDRPSATAAASQVVVTLFVWVLLYTVVSPFP